MSFNNITKKSNHFDMIAIIFLLATFSFFTNISKAHAEFPDCYPAQTEGGHLEVCQAGGSDGKRRDIDPACLRSQSANHCINIIPTTQNHDAPRVPENICYRTWTKPPRNHNGMDYSATSADDVSAAMDGILESMIPGPPQCAGKTSGPSGAGNYVVIRHDLPVGGAGESLPEPPKEPGGKDKPIVDSPHQKCLRTRYLHLTNFAPGLTQGQKITKGTVLGKAGGSGCNKSGMFSNDAYGSHLHFEILDCSGSPIDPMCSDLMNVCNPKSSQPFDPHKSEDQGGCRDCNGPCPDTVGTHTSIPSVKTAFGSGGRTGLASSDNATYGAIGGSCSFQNYRTSFKDCVFCDAFMIIFNTSSSFAQRAFSTLQMPVLNLVLMGFALWLVYTVFINISSMKQKEPRRMIKEILTQAAIVLFIIVLLLFGSTGVFSLFIEPIFNTGLKFAMLLSESNKLNATETVCDFPKVADIQGGLPQAMGQNILCVIKTIQDTLVDVVALGSTFICIGFKDKAIFPYLFPHFGYLITGLVVWFVSIAMFLVYPWLLIDAVFKMAISVALFPAALGAAAFKITRKYIGIVFGTFLTSMFVFVFLSIIMFLLLDLLYQTLGEAIMKDLQEVGDGSVIGDLLDKVGWWTVTFMQLTFIIILMSAVLDNIDGLASSFGGIAGGGLNYGSNIGSSVGTTMLSAAKEASKTPRGLASKGLKKVGTNISNRASAFSQSVKMKTAENRIKGDKNSKVNEDGSITKTRKNWKGHEITETIKQGANGEPVIIKSVNDGKNTKTTESSKYMNINSKTNNATGEELSKSFDLKSKGLQKLYNKKGEIEDMVSINDFIQNSGHSKEECMAALMQKTLEERHGNKELISTSDFKDRKMSLSQDEKGNMVFSLSQKDHVGKEQRFSMTLGEKRARTEVETINKKGKSSALISDGVFNIHSSRQYNEDRTDFKAKNSYSVNEYYASGKNQAILGNKVNKRIYDNTMLSAQEIGEAAYQKKRTGL